MKPGHSVHRIVERRLSLGSAVTSEGPIGVLTKFRTVLFGSMLRAFITVSILLAGISAIGWILFYDTDVDRGLGQLKKAFQYDRPLESRLNGFPYAKFSVARGGAATNIDSEAKNNAGKFLLNLNSKPSVKARHGAALYYLTDRKFDDAIRLLEPAVSDSPDSTEIRNDLGVAFMERAMSGTAANSLGDLARGLEHLTKATQAKDASPAAHFNRALCIQRMNTLAIAKEAWENYIKLDKNSEWSREASASLLKLQNQPSNNKTPDQVLADFLDAWKRGDRGEAWRIESQTKEMINGTMIPFQLTQQFVRMTLENQPEGTARTLDALWFVGELESNKSGDPFFAELANYYTTDGQKNVVLLDLAQKALRNGYELCLKGLYGEAQQYFEKSHDLFGTAGNKWEHRIADYWLAYSLSNEGKLTQSSELLTDLVRDSQNHRHIWLEEQAHCWLANTNGLQGEYSNLVEENKKAAEQALAIGDLYNSQKASSQLAETYRIHGRLREALEFNRNSLPTPDEYYASNRQYLRSLNSTTDTLYALHLYSAAEVYQQEAINLATHYFDDPVLAHNTLLRLGQIQSGMGKYTTATRYLEQSLKVVEKIANDNGTHKLIGQSEFQLGNIKRESGDCRSALNSYQQSLLSFDSGEYGRYSYNSHKGMLLCYLQNRDEMAIQRELPIVLSLFELNRKKIREEQNRNPFFDNEQNIYDLAIEYEYSRSEKNIGQSFNYAESSKARSLLDAIGKGASVSPASQENDIVSIAALQPLTLEQLQEQLPDDLPVVEYAVLHDRLLIWVITKGHYDVIERKISQNDLELLVNEYMDVVQRDDSISVEREQELAMQLHDNIFAPVETLLNGAKEIVVIPDKFLFKLPFAVLISRRTGLRLPNNYAVLYSPSATVLVLCSKLASEKIREKVQEKLLSVGNPQFDRQRYSGLADLPASADEAQKIAEYYSSRSVLLMPEAIKQQVLSELTDADVFHFAGHYVTDTFSPEKSKLILAAGFGKGTTDEESSLSLSEIETTHLSNIRLAILSACESGVEQYYAGEGFIGLSRSFIKAGVPLVISTQWSIESDSTAEMMIAFHRYRKEQNLPTVEALRQAQLFMLNNPDTRYRRPYYWAAFFSVGGIASF